MMSEQRPLQTILVCCLVCALSVSCAAFIIGRRMGSRRPLTEGYEGVLGASINLDPVVQELRATRGAIATQGKREPWTDKRVEVFESFMNLNGMPPTDTAMDHYMYVSTRNALSREDLFKRIKADVTPEEDEEVAQ